MIALWKVFKVFLEKKYINKQARNIIRYHREEDDLRTKQHKGWLYFCSCEHLRQYCCMKTEEMKARKRLG